MVCMFAYESQLTDISGLATWDMSRTKDIGGMFYQTSITNVNPLKNWDTSSLTCTYAYYSGNDFGLFAQCSELSDISGLSKWNTANIQDFSYMFAKDKALVNISALENWDTSSATTMEGMFSEISITSTSDLSSWNVENLTCTYTMFAYNPKLVDASSIGEWHLVKLTNSRSMFASCSSLTRISMENWNTSSIKDKPILYAYAMFHDCDNLNTITLGENNTKLVIEQLPDGPWMRTDNKYGPYTDGQTLASNWNSSTMAGTYVKQSAN